MVVVMAMLAVLALPLLGWAEETPIPPEARWTPTPPARHDVDVGQLAQLLVAKGVISDQEYAQLTQPRPAATASQGHDRVWTWEEIDRNPARTTP
jgi:hypothetical protein